MTVTHAFVNPKADAGDATIVRPSDWNAVHQGTPGREYNITDVAYGASTGAADNTTAINAAITAANAAGGGTVLVPRGEFVAVGIVLKSNVHLRGTGYGSVIKLKNGSNTAVISGTTGTVVNASVSDMKIDGNKANQTEHNFCFGIAIGYGSGALGCDYMTVQNVWVANSLRSAIYLEGAHNSVLNCLVTDCGNTTDPGRTGIVISGENVPGGYGRVIGNNVRNCTEYGMKVYPNSDYSVLANNVVETSTRYGIYIQTSDHVAMIGNVISGAAEVGILIQATEDGLSSNNCSVTGGSIRGCGLGGIKLWAAGTGQVRHTTITGVAIEGNLGSGISIQLAPNTTITGCSIVGNGTVFAAGHVGIDVYPGGSDNVTISGNLIKNNGNTTFGVGIWSFLTNTDFTITGNRIFNDGAGLQTTGISMGGSCDFWTITGNNVRGNLTAGMALVGANNVVADNIGWVMEKSGATSVADGGTITHGLAATPTRVRCTPSTSGEMVSVTALGATTFTVAIKKHDGTAGTTAVVYWQATV